MKGQARKAVEYAEAHGYTFERQNVKGMAYYRHSSGHEVGIHPNCTDDGLRRVMKDVDRARGIGPDLSQKRNPEQIRARAEKRRQHEAERRRLEELARQRKADLLAGAGGRLSEREIRAITREIEQYERRIRELEQLMQPISA